ncbi:MAG: RraA family protein [Nitrososphaerales archaeon]
MEEILNKLKEFDSPTIANAIEHLKIRERIEGYTNQEVKCIFPEFGVLVGYALTVEIDSMAKDAKISTQGLVDFVEEVEKMKDKPVVVVAKDVSKVRMIAALWGGLMSMVCKRCGAEGLVTDGAVRDLADARKIKFHYFASGIVVSHGYSTFVKSVGKEINVAGMKVRKGDIIHADENGVISFPKDKAEEVLKFAEKVRSIEGEIVALSQSKDFSFDKLRKYWG